MTGHAGLRSARAVRVLALSSAAQLMVVLDISVVNVALPSIQRDLGFSAASLPWVVNAYALVFAGFLLLGGRLADLLGHRRVFLLGLGLFGAAGLAGGLATSPVPLIAARAMQGFGAAVLAPITLTLLTAEFPEGPRRTRAVAVWAAAGSAGGTAGNLVGGLLTEALSWRWTLLVNVPVAAAAMLAAARNLARPAAAGRSRGGLDLPGALLATGGLMALAYGITGTEEHGWGDGWVLLPLALGLAALAGFLALQVRPARTPLLPLRLFRSRGMWLGNLLMLLAGASLMPMWYFLSLYMQRVLNYGPLATGLGFSPHTVLGALLGVRLTPRAMKRVGARTLIASGALIAAAGFVWQSRTDEAGGYVAGVLGPGVVMTFGSALFITPLTTTVVSGVAQGDAGAASGVMNTVKQVGSGFGLAVLVLLTGDTDGTRADLADGYGRTFLAMAALLSLVAVLALALPARRDAPERSETASAGEAAAAADQT